MWEIIKRLLLDDAFFFTILILLVGVSSFGLGRMSVLDTTDIYPNNNLSQVANISDSENNSQKINSEAVQVVVSKNGTKYYALWCSGVSKIKEENKVYYNSPAEAQAAGYTLAANCEGLD